MKVRMRIVLPAMLALAGCTSTATQMGENAGPAMQTSAAPPQRVDAASNALGARLDSIMATRHIAPATVTR